MAKRKNLVRQQAAKLKNGAEEMIEEGVDNVGDYADQLRERVRERWQKTRDAAKEGVHQADEYAHDHPWQMAAVGAVAGFLLAALIMRRRD